MTLREIAHRLSQSGVEGAGYEARCLVAHFTGLSQAEILAEPQRDYPGEDLTLAVQKREGRYPLQYILGKAGFYGEEFSVSPACLIPRADTEILVEKAISLLPPGAVFTDLGTGCGCIALSVLKHRPDCRACALDISEAALAVARGNALALGLADRVSFCLADMCAPLPREAAQDFILSNPPYISTKAMAALAPELASEPQNALWGGEDGMDFYRAILKNNTPRLALFEIGFDQGEKIRALGAENGYRVEITKDLGGNDRVALLS